MPTLTPTGLFTSAPAARPHLSHLSKYGAPKGLALKSFVDKVKAGKWGNVMSAVANLGAAATSVGVSVGVAAAEPLAKDLARSFEELTGSAEVRFFSGGGGWLSSTPCTTVRPELAVYLHGMGTCVVHAGGKHCVGQVPRL